MGIRTLPWRERDTGFPVSWVGDDISGIASYDIQRSIDGGPWVAWLNATTQTSAFYLGAAGHGYAFRVRARDTKGNTALLLCHRNIKLAALLLQAGADPGVRNDDGETPLQRAGSDEMKTLLIKHGAIAGCETGRWQLICNGH